MALTFDEKKEILELYGRGYSQGKIADRTGHSPTTIRNVINEAAEEVVKLKAEGLEREQIAVQLDYPLAFIDIALKKHGEKQEGEVKAEIEAEGTAEEIESPKKLDLKAELSEFQKKQEIEQRKERIRVRAIDLEADLEFDKKYYEKQEVFDIVYDASQKLIRKELKDFVLAKVDEIDSIEAISDLEHIVEEIVKKIDALSNKYDAKAKRLRKVHMDRDKARSNQLLDQRIDIPLFPQSMKEQVKEQFLVRNAEEASTVADALTRIALLIMDISHKKPEKEEEMWQTFTRIVKEGGWDYLKQMAAQYREDTERMLVSINVCPRCESKLTRKWVEDIVIISCPSCGKSYQILEK